jgi:glycosyltransferase involved in cell wall biosynthesis
MTSPSGILWAGALFDRGGYGNVSRNYVLSLRSARIPVRIFNLGHVHSEVDPATAQIIKEHASTDIGDRPIGVVHSLPHFIPQLTFKGISGTATASIFETDGLPQGWAELSNRMDQVWIPSRFNLATYAGAGVTKSKLKVIPIPVDCEYFKPGFERRSIPGAKGFIFLYVFSFGWRKGFDLLLRAYMNEFSDKDDVTLVLKVYPGNPRVSDLSSAVLSVLPPELNPGKPGRPRVVVLADPIPQDELRSLYASCDVYVSTDRANGWGMPCIEVMAMGKAAATIDWSGSTEFMVEENSFLIHPTKELEPVDPRLVEANAAVYGGQRWAKVEESEVRRVLRRAYEDRALVHEKGARALEDIRKHFSIEAIGRTFRQVFEEFPASDRARGTPDVRFTWKTRARRFLGNSLRKFIPRLRS